MNHPKETKSLTRLLKGFMNTYEDDFKETYDFSFSEKLNAYVAKNKHGIPIAVFHRNWICNIRNKEGELLYLNFLYGEDVGILTQLLIAHKDLKEKMKK